MPQDVAVVGVGDIALQVPRVPLTTVGWSCQEEGRHAAELLLAGLDDDSAEENAAPRRIIIPPTLIVRESCGARP